MKRTILAAIALAGVAGTIALPTIVSGNARRTDGSLAAQQQAETAYIASMSGAQEVPPAGGGTGTATVSFAEVDATNTEVCFDMVYTGIGDPTVAHIHVGAAGASGPPVVLFGDPTPNSFSDCVMALTTDVAPIIANPAGFYVNVHDATYPNGAVRGQLAAGSPPAGSMHFLSAPARAYDSRVAPATMMAAGETRTVSLASGVGPGGSQVVAVPPGATAAIVTLTATATGGPGFLTIYSNAVTQTPATSNLNFTTAGLSIAVSTQVAVDAGGSIKVTAGPAATHVVIDVVGYLY